MAITMTASIAYFPLAADFGVSLVPVELGDSNGANRQDFYAPLYGIHRDWDRRDWFGVLLLD